MSWIELIDKIAWPVALLIIFFSLRRLIRTEFGGQKMDKIWKETLARLDALEDRVKFLENIFSALQKELKIDTYRASGAGGQHVNVTDSAVRITHIPSGSVVTCQDERSQHKNKAKAMRLLSAKLLEDRRKKQKKEMSQMRSTQIGTGDRSERIRTYNFPQNRVSDHRINLTLYKLDQIIQGDLDDVTNALLNYYYQEKLIS